MRTIRSTIQWLVLPSLITIVGLAQTAGDPAKNDNAGKNTAGAVATSSTASQDGDSDAPAPQSSASQDADQKIQQLEKRVDELDKKLEAASNSAPAAGGASAGSVAKVTADLSGFTIQSADKNFLLKIGADLQLDNRTFLGDAQSTLSDTALLRRVRPTFSGTVFQYVDYFFRPDFGQGSTVIYDAYVELKYFSKFKVRAGKFKPPVGLERLQSDDDTSFVERGLPTLLVASRDIGYQVSGDIVNSRVTYAVGVFNGVPDNSLSDSAASDHRDYTARLFLTPFQPDENFLSGLGFGAGASSGNVDGEALPSYKTFGQNSFFTFASGVAEAGHRTRLAPGAYYYLGPFGLYSEYGLTEEGLQKGTVRRDIAFRAYQAAVSYILTGERKSFLSPVPKRNFDPRNNGWGAVEVAARVGEFAAEDGIYNYGFASATTTPRTAREWVGGVNWYLNRLVRLSGDYGHTAFGGGATVAAGINRPPEKAIIFRIQINFI